MLRRTAASMTGMMLAVTSLVACGGADDPDPDTTPTVEGFDIDALDLGRIDPTGTDVSSFLTPEKAKTVAGYELGEYLVMPMSVDSKVNRYGVESGVVSTVSDLDFKFNEAAEAFAGAEAGVISRRTRDNADAWVTTALLQFPDPASAQAAAEAAAASLVQPDSYGDVEFVIEPLSTDPDAIVVATTTSDVANRIYVLRAFGPFVAYLWLYDIDGTMDDLRDLIPDYLLDQEYALDGVDPVPVPEEPDVRDLDPTGLWHLTLALDSRGSASEYAFIAQRHSSLINLINSDGAARAFSHAGVSNVASNLTVLYSTKSKRGAQSLVEFFAENGLEDGLVETDPPPGLPEARCFDTEGDDTFTLSWYPDFSCFVAFGAYVVESSGVSLAEAHQRASAQVVLIHQDMKDDKRSSSGG